MRGEKIAVAIRDREMERTFYVNRGEKGKKGLEICQLCSVGLATLTYYIGGEIDIERRKKTQ